MEELSREEIVTIAIEARFGKHEVMKDINKFEQFARLVQRYAKEDDFDMDGRC
jgi:hypothetical protein